MKEVVLDAGALIALERGKREVRALVLLAERGLVVLTTKSPFHHRRQGMTSAAVF